MSSVGRPVSLTATEASFRFDRWIRDHLTIDDDGGVEWVCVCPWCGRTKLAVNTQIKAFQCLSIHCRQRSWHPTKLVAHVEGVTWDQAEALMAAYSAGVSMEMPTFRPEQEAKQRDPSMLPQASLPPVVWDLQPEQAAYVASRGISEEHARGLMLGTILDSGRESQADRMLRTRVIFPIWNHAGTLVFWVARSVDPRSRIRYVNMPRSCRDKDHPPGCTCYHERWGLPPVPYAAHGHEVVYGLHWLTPGEPAYLVEGPADVAVCGPGFCSMLGSSLDPVQAQQIAEAKPSDVYVVLDGGSDERAQARKVAMVMRRFHPSVKVVDLPDRQDPGSLGRARVLELAHRPPALDLTRSSRNLLPKSKALPAFPEFGRKV